MSGEHFPRGSTAEFDQKPRTACGVFGTFDPNGNARSMAYVGAEALQHRGQEGAGISVSLDGTLFAPYSEIGLVRDVFRDGDPTGPLGGLPENAQFALANTRYGTHPAAGDSKRYQRSALMPVTVRTKRDAHDIHLVENGQISNHEELAVDYGITRYATDCELIAKIVTAEYEKLEKPSWGQAVSATATQLEGGFALIFMTGDGLIAVRDRRGRRPLVIGHTQDRGVVLASEIGALNVVGATQNQREVAPAEMIEVTKDTISYSKFGEAQETKLCTIELNYLSKEDNTFFGESVLAYRERIGEQLAMECPADVDVVVSVPDSGLAVGRGFARVSGLKEVAALVKNGYIGRTFISPTNSERRSKTHRKFRIVPGTIDNLRVVVVDDSVIRGNTTLELVDQFYEAGATEVHVRSGLPKVIGNCYYGVDLARQDELLARYGRSDAEIAAAIGATTVGFIPVEEYRSPRVVGPAAGKLCLDCMLNQYDVKPPRATSVAAL